MNKDSLFIATFSRAAVTVASEYGIGLEINDLCISENLEPENRERVINRIEKEIRGAYGDDWFTAAPEERRKVIMHGPFTELTPAAIDPRAIELMDRRYDETIDICRTLGINDLVLHDGYIPLIYQKSWHLKKSIEYWRRFSDRLPDDMTAYIENVFDDEPELLTEIVDSVGRENIKICLDVGHANVMTGADLPVSEWVRIMGPYIGHFHLHNNYGDADLHNDVFDGTLGIEMVLGMAEDVCSEDVTFTIESKEARQSVEFLL